MKETIYYNIRRIKEVRKNDKKEFCSYFNESEYKKIMNYFLKDKTKELFDGANTRVDSIVHEEDGDIITISDITFFDYMSSNILLLHNTKLIEYLEDRNEKELIDKLIEFYEKCDSLSQISDILNSKWMANLAAVSVLICDRNGKYGVVKRGDRTAVSAGFWAVSVTGCIENNDFQKQNPIVECCIRETKEELNITLYPENVNIRGISFDKKKLQPIIICDAQVEDTWEDMIGKAIDGTEYALEVSGIYPIEQSELDKILQYSNMTAASRVHMQLHCPKGYQQSYIEEAL